MGKVIRLREGDQGESSPIGRESDREGEIDNKGDKSEGKGTSDNDLTEREVYDTTLEGDGAKSKNDGAGSNSQSATKKRLRNQKYYQSHKKCILRAYHDNPSPAKRRMQANYHANRLSIRLRKKEAYASNPSPAKRRTREAYAANPSPSLTGLATDIKVTFTSDNNEKFKLHF